MFTNFSVVAAMLPIMAKLSRLQIILCFIFYKNETADVPKKSLAKLEMSQKRHNIFKIGMTFSGEIYDKAFYQMILPNHKNFRFLKRI